MIFILKTNNWFVVLFFLLCFGHCLVKFFEVSQLECVCLLFLKGGDTGEKKESFPKIVNTRTWEKHTLINGLVSPSLLNSVTDRSNEGHYKYNHVSLVAWIMRNSKVPLKKQVSKKTMCKQGHTKNPHKTQTWHVLCIWLLTKLMYYDFISILNKTPKCIAIPGKLRKENKENWLARGGVFKIKIVKAGPVELCNINSYFSSKLSLCGVN